MIKTDISDTKYVIGETRKRTIRMTTFGKGVLLVLLASSGSEAFGQTINIDVKPSSSSEAAYSGSDGVLSSGGSYWNHSVSNAANLAYEDASASGVALVLLQDTYGREGSLRKKYSERVSTSPSSVRRYYMEYMISIPIRNMML